MSRLTNVLGNINWVWFTTAKQKSTTDVLLSIETIDKIVSSLEFTTQDQQETLTEVNTLLYTMLGIDPNSKKDIKVIQWYNNWLSQTYPTQFAFNINYIRDKIRVSQTTDVNAYVVSMNVIADYILYKFFGNPIPEPLANAGNYPLIVDNTSNYYTPMLDELYKFFYNGNQGIGGIGNETIQEMCMYFTREQIVGSTPFTKWCGCFSPNSTLTTEALKTAPNAQSYTKQCDPLCINPKTIKLVEGENDDAPYTIKRCVSDICIIGPEMIQNVDSTGTINFNQACPCASGTQACFCIIDSTVENFLNKAKAPNGGSMAFNVTFNQYCPNSQCYISNNGVLTQIECNSQNPASSSTIDKSTKKTVTVSRDLWILALLIIAAGILFVLCARHIGYEPKYKVQGVLKPSASLSKSTSSRTIHNYI